MMKQKTNSLSELKFGALPYRENEMMHSIIDNNIISKFNWTPKFSIEEGIERTLEFE